MSLIDRGHYVPHTKRRENDLEHSFTVALLCWYIFEKNQLDLDLPRILKYAMAHDFVERYAGDVSSFASAKERHKKIEREHEALQRLSDEFAGFPNLVETMQQYELREDEESLFVWSVDKMQQLIMGDLDNWIAYMEAGITYEAFVEKYTGQAEQSSKYCREIFESLTEYSMATYPKGVA